jgi:Flp pilus assembly protein TadD
MLPPLPMLAKKNRIRCAAIFLTLAVLAVGCTPAGPRALLKGKKLLERGDALGAVEQFKTATALLATNAQAWNYLGVACQRAGQPADAAAAYQRALTLDRDLVEAHYNLGSLWLEQNKPADARMEFTAYTLRRGNDPEGWLKLGSAQLRTGDFLASEKSFSTALSLSPNNAEALNGLGLARIERGRPREAMQFFSAAMQYHPDYAPALLNLATVADQNLHDRKFALQNYRAYLALTPRAADWDAVNEVVKNLEQPTTLAAANPPAIQNPPAATQVNQPKPAVHSSAQKPVSTTPHNSSTLPPRLVSSARPQEVKVQPETVIVTTPGKQGESASLMPIQNPASNPSSPEKRYVESGVTPLPPPGGAQSRESKPVIVPPSPPSFPRYLYLSPREPADGNRAAASVAFAQAQNFEHASRLADAMQAYRQAAQLDPAWFEAQYDYAVTAYRLRDFDRALPAYENALAIQPGSNNTRYNFAVALKTAGFVTDAVNEFKKIVAADPGESRAQLALGNIYAQQLHDPARARAYYLKVLELDPRNPHATDIQFWLSANPG